MQTLSKLPGFKQQPLKLSQSINAFFGSTPSALNGSSNCMAMPVQNGGGAAGFHWRAKANCNQMSLLNRINVGSGLICLPKRNLMLHEYQAAQLVHKYMIPIPKGTVAFTAKEAFTVGRKFGPDFKRQFVVKAQVQGFARTKGVFRENGFKSGIHMCDSIDQVQVVADKMLGKHLVLPGGDENGLMVNSVLVMEHLEIDQQYFLGIWHDSRKGQPVIVYSDVGGLSYARLQMLYPERIHRMYIDYQKGIDFVSLAQVAEKMGIKEQSRISFMIKNLYEMFLQRDCLAVTINPLVVTPERKFIAANTFIRLDPDSLYRQQEMGTAIDLSQMTKNERMAWDMDIKYTDFPGNIGVISNSAGLGMAINDAIVSYGGQPANFADVGGAAIHEQIDALFHVVNGNRKVKVLYINCYGGITNIKKVLATLILGLKNQIVTKPVVIRALGLGADDIQGQLGDWMNKHPIHIESDFDTATQLAVSIADSEEKRTLPHDQMITEAKDEHFYQSPV